MSHNGLCASGSDIPSCVIPFFFLCLIILFCKTLSPLKPFQRLLSNQWHVLCHCVSAFTYRTSTWRSHKVSAVCPPTWGCPRTDLYQCHIFSTASTLTTKLTRTYWPLKMPPELFNYSQISLSKTVKPWLYSLKVICNYFNIMIIPLLLVARRRGENTCMMNIDFWSIWPSQQEADHWSCCSSI